MKIRSIIESEYEGLEDSDEFRDRRTGPDFLPRERTLTDIARDLEVLTRETNELITDWNRLRAESILRVLRARAYLLQLLIEKDYET